MEEVIKYFETLESRITVLEQELTERNAQLSALEQQVNELEKQVEELEQRPVAAAVVQVAEPEAVTEPEEKEEIAAMPDVNEEPEAKEEEEAAIAAEPIIEEPEAEEPIVAEPEKKEEVSPKAALYGKAVDDIRLAISLGDRFLYQRELFNQNAELMQRTLDELNHLISFDDATAYISSHFQWDTESNTYQQFLVTLHRRFG